jgi:hypothetical protein
MEEKKQIVGKQYFRAQFDRKSINVDKRTVDVVFVTERQVMMYNWDIGLFYEVLPCNDLNGDLSRLNSGAPVCDTHNTDSVRNGLGVVETAWFDNGVGRATLRLSKRADVESVWQDIQDGIITGVSVGYLVYEYEEIGEKNNLPLIRANKWEGTEISFALVQADVDSGVGRSGDSVEKHEVSFIRNHTKKTIMTDAEKAALAAERVRSATIFKLCRAANLGDDYAQELVEGEMTVDQAKLAIAEKARQLQPPAPAPAPVNDTEVRAAAAKAERTRINDIRTAARLLNLEDAFVAPLIDGDVTADEARRRMLDESARLNPVGPRPQSGVALGADEADKKTRGMEAALLQRAGVLKADTVGDPGEFRGLSLMDLARECLEATGVKVRGMNVMEIASRALQMKGRDGGGGMSSGDFSYILQNVMNKTLRAMYDLQPRTFLPWSRKTTSNDFKNILRTQLSDIKLAKVQEGGEYSFATVSDSGETYKVAKYGKIVNIDWEAIVNDDLSAFSRIPTLLAAAVAQMQGDLMYQILTGAETMGDGIALFNAATHKNYTTPGTDISVDSLSVARKQFRQQLSPGGSPLNLAPKFLVCGPNKETVALQYLSANYTATKAGDINVWAGSMQPIVESRITDNAWFLVADPSQIDTAEYAVLEGQEIFTESRYGFDVDAFQYKVRSVFGKKAIEWRSFYKNAGA